MFWPKRPVRSWSLCELCYALEERYCLTNSAFVNRSKLRRISQQKEQSIQQVADEFLKLVRCSFSAPPREHDIIAVDYFIDAIQDPELKRHIMQKEPIAPSIVTSITSSEVSSIALSKTSSIVSSLSLSMASSIVSSIAHLVASSMSSSITSSTASLIASSMVSN